MAQQKPRRHFRKVTANAITAPVAISEVGYEVGFGSTEKDWALSFCGFKISKSGSHSPSKAHPAEKGQDSAKDR